MKIKIFIGSRMAPLHENDWQTLKHEGKEYFGFFFDRETVTIKELDQMVKKMGEQHQLTLFPVLLFG